MQAAINALINLGTASNSASAAGAGASGQGDDTSPGNQFAQLLSDSGAHADDQGAQQFTRGQLMQANTSAALVAQDMAKPAADILEGLLQSDTKMISAQDAGDLIKRIDAMAAHADSKSVIAALNQIKDQLKLIQTTGQPKTVAEIISAAPALKDAGIALPALAALLESGKPPAPASTTEEAPAQVTAAMQNLPAMVFRAVRREDTSAAGDKVEEKKKNSDALADAVAAAVNATVVVIQPTAYVEMVPLAAANAQDVAAAASLHARQPLAPAQPQLVPQAQPLAVPTVPLQPRPDLDEAIPPLALAPADNLPHVDLPQAGPVLADEKSGQQTDKKGDAIQQLAALAAFAQEPKPLEAANTANNAQDIQSISSLLSASHAGGHIATQTANAVQAAPHLVTPGYINHAPVTDQVHVAINQAAKDGIDRITIQLDPVDLGRVEVHMQRSHDGQTQISFTVDKPETFDSLSRDARFLERSLQEAGIKADTGSMQFNLRQQPQLQLQSGLDGQGQPQQQTAEPDDEKKTSSATPIQSVASFSRNYILNIREGVDISA